MNAIALIREQMNTAHEWMEGTMADVTPEAAHFRPGGSAHPIGSRYAHAVVAEDMLINGVLRGAAPLHASTPTGLEDPQAAFFTTHEWAHSVQVDLDALREYARQVYAGTDAYLAGLAPENLDDEVDLSEYGYGKWSLGGFLLSFIFAHVHDIMGEISAIKGVQGLKGYPF